MAESGDGASPALHDFGAYGPYILTGGSSGGQKPRMRWRCGWAYHLYLVEDGTIQVEDGTGTERVRPQNAILVCPGDDAWVQVAPGAVWWWLVFDAIHQPWCVDPIPGPGRRHADATPQPGPRAVWGVDLPRRVPRPILPGLRQTMLEVCAQWWRHGLWRMRSNHRLGLWLADLVDHVRGEANPGDRDLMANLRAEAVRRLGQGLRVADLAAWLGISAGHLNRRIHALTGLSTRAWLLDLRFEHAATHLRAGRPVAEAARWGGWRSVATFSHAFTSRYGMPPRSWARQQGRTG